MPTTLILALLAGVGSLDGTWDGRLGEHDEPWQPMRVPGNLSFQGVHYEGVFWLRTHFEVAAPDTDWALRVPMAANAYELFLNGQKVGENGRLGPTGELLEKSLRGRVFRLPQATLHAGSNELALRIRTFEGNGGIMAPGVLVGPEADLRDRADQLTARVSMMVALFLFAGFFHIILFLGHRRERHHVSFAFLCGGLASVTAGLNTLGYLLTSNSDFNAYLVFLPLVGMPFALVLFFSDFFVRPAKVLLRSTGGLAVVGIIVLISSTLHHPLYPFFERVLLPLCVLALVTALAISTWWTLQGARAGQLGALAILTGLGAYALTGVLELAWVFGLVDLHFDSYLGFAFFIGAVVTAIGRRVAWLHQEVEKGERDALTGCLTRHGFYTRFAALEAHARLSCISFDLDHFKNINDTRGHQVGDQVLARTSEAVRATLRGADIFARWGGEEFLVVLPACDLAKALEVAGRMQLALKVQPIEGLTVSASFGVAQRGSGESLEAWLGRADAALYEAKHAGRNCVRPERVSQPVAAAPMAV